MNINSMLQKICVVFTCCALLAPLGGCSAPASTAPTPAAGSRTVAVQRGNLITTVPVDGKLDMPQAFTLNFGAPGDVREVLVEEGDTVKAGQILARLDDTSQRLDVRSANGDLQSTLSNLYETVPRLPQFPTKFYSLVETTKVVEETDETTSYTVFNFPDTDPMPVASGPTTVTTVKGSTPGTVTVTETVTTVTLAPGTAFPSNTTTVTTKVVTTTTTTTTTLLTKPRFDYKWDATQGWVSDPNIPPNTGLSTGYPGYYPNYGLLISFDWAQNELAAARELLSAGQHAAAALELDAAIADMEDCIQIIQATLSDPNSGLGNLTPFVSDNLSENVYLQILLDSPPELDRIIEFRGVVDRLRGCQADMEQARALVAREKPEEASPLLQTLSDSMEAVGGVVLNIVNSIVKRDSNVVYGKNICSYLYAAADARLSQAFDEVQKGGMNTPEFQNNLRIAKHEMALCNAILGTNDYVLQHGLSLKAEQQYKLDLQNKLVTLRNRQDDFIKTVIMSPCDGIVVDVSVKKNDVLSAQDYSSKGTIQVVDTSQIKFVGQVDEIDILKIRTGQKASVSIDALPDKSFTGKVSFISPFGTRVGNVVKFPITILLDPTDVALKGNLTATADIAISTAENVLLVPLAAITTTTEGSFVSVIDEATGQAEKRKITTGGQNLQFAEVLSGLKESEKVVVELEVTGAPISTRFRPGGGGAPPPR